MGPQVMPMVGSRNPARWLSPGMAGTMGDSELHDPAAAQPETSMRLFVRLLLDASTPLA
jgi:hypothetical protein